MSDNLDYYIQKIIGINKKLGGTEEQTSNKRSSEFDNLKFVIQEKSHEIKAKQQERDKKVDRDKNSVEIITLRHEIKMSLDEVKELLSQMGRILVKQARNPKVFFNILKPCNQKYPKSELELRQSIYENLQRDFQMVNNYEYGEGYANDDDNRVKRLSELKKDLWDRKEIELEDIRVEANEEELQAMEEFKKKDKYQDEFIGRINNGLTELKPKVQLMGDKIDQTRVQIHKNEKEIDIVNAELLTQNQRLKKILKELLQYRAPSKFCLDIVLVLMILGLIGTIYTLLKN